MEESLGEAVAKFPPFDPETGDTVEGFLSKFVLIAEWVDSEGNRYLIRRSENGMGEGVASWDANGLLYEGLFGKFKEHQG